MGLFSFATVSLFTVLENILWVMLVQLEWICSVKENGINTHEFSASVFVGFCPVLLWLVFVQLGWIWNVQENGNNTHESSASVFVGFCPVLL